MSRSSQSKKRDNQEPGQDDSLFSPEMQKKRYEAAMDFVKVLQEKFLDRNGTAHAGTVLSTAARLAGTSLFRSLQQGKEFEPGVVVLSKEVNEAWPQLMNLFAFYCQQNGIDVMSRPLVTKIPEKDQPRLELVQTQLEFQGRYDQIMKKHRLDYLNGARAGMVTCSIIFQYHCMVVKDIDPFVATGIVAMGVIEGAKTAPPPLRSAT